MFTLHPPYAVGRGFGRNWHVFYAPTGRIMSPPLRLRDAAREARRLSREARS